MTKYWLNSTSSTDSASFSSQFWERHRQELASGRFWADRIAELRDEPKARLENAIANLPLPAAFREAAIATRALARASRRLHRDHQQDLALLYWLAAVESFSIPYSERLREPGYNVLEAVPGDVLRSLPFSYACLGYSELRLLNRTDIKWIVEAWGEPASHTTLHKLHNDVWMKYEDIVLASRAGLLSKALLEE